MSPVPLKTRHVGQRCTLSLSRAETPFRWCGVVARKVGCQLRCRPRHLTMVQNYVVRRQKPSCCRTSGLNWGGIEPNRTVTCMVIKATANDRRHLALCYDEFRWPRSSLCRSDSERPRGKIERCASLR
ncbi:uncharacterized protein TNCV_4457451 [Trichonephila clavipes]|nr:uncharacterized protein TNCV_4457451 [Trichonephila clavipes]